MHYSFNFVGLEISAMDMKLVTLTACFMLLLFIPSMGKSLEGMYIATEKKTCNSVRDFTISCVVFIPFVSANYVPAFYFYDFFIDIDRQ